MKKDKIILMLAAIAVLLSFNLQGSALYSENKTLQWFPSLTADNGTVYVVWADERNGNYTRIMNNQPHKSGDIYLSKGTFKDGWSFDKNIRVNELKGSTGHGSPSIAVDSNNIYVVWEDDRFGFEELYFTYSPKKYIRFTKDVAVVEAAGSQVLPSIAVLNRTVYVAMMNKKTWDIDFAEGNAVNGVYGFIASVKVNDDSGGWHYAPSLAVDDEKNVCIAWLDARNGDYDIYFSHGKKEKDGWLFGRNFRVNDDANASQYTPSIAFENGNAYIAWYDDRNKDFDVYLSKGRLGNDGWRFDKSIRVNDETKGDQMHPEVALANGEIFVAWEDGREGSSGIYFSNGSLRNGSIEFGRNVKVNDAGGSHYSPKLRAENGNIYIVWQAETGTDSGDIYFSRGRYSGKTWEFGRSMKVNDDITNSFVEPDPVLPGLILGTVAFSIIIVGFLRGKNER